MYILGMKISNTENNNNNDFYSYLQKNDLTYINYINQIHLTCRESPSPCAVKEIRDNYQHQE